MAILIPSILFLSGCASSSIRVEVDVYKGPLSKPVPIQKAELIGIIKDSFTATKQFKSLLDNFRSFHECSGMAVKNKKSNNLANKPLKESSSITCEALSSLVRQTTKLNDNLKTLDSNLDNNTSLDKEILAAAANIAFVMKTQSATTAAAFIPLTSGAERLRVAQAMFSTMTAEFGNLIGSRATTLMIQEYGYDDDTNIDGGISRKNLHLNMYLADSSATKASRLYEWYDAKAPFILEEWKYFIPGYNVSMVDRIRIYETLYNDTYWSNINTVYASGAGDVGMALIRDDIGNWNLKNFDNDPAELLAAYKDATLAGIKATTKLISSAASGGSSEALHAALSLANQFTTPLDATTSSRVPITEWHNRVKSQIQAVNKKSQTDWEKAKCKETPTDNSCKEITKDTIVKIKAILRDYSVALNTLQEINVMPQTSKPSIQKSSYEKLLEEQ